MLIHTNAALEVLDSYTWKLNINFPKIFLDNNPYKISVRSVSFKMENGDYSIFTLHSTVIDKNNLNPNQELLSFSPSEVSYINFYCPNKPFEYKIQIKDVHTAEFTLSCTKTVHLFDISNLRIIFEIERDVRIQ